MNLKFLIFFVIFSLSIIIFTNVLSFRNIEGLIKSRNKTVEQKNALLKKKGRKTIDKGRKTIDTNKKPKSKQFAKKR